MREVVADRYDLGEPGEGVAPDLSLSAVLEHPAPGADVTGAVLRQASDGRDALAAIVVEPHRITA